MSWEALCGDQYHVESEADIEEALRDWCPDADMGAVYMEVTSFPAVVSFLDARHELGQIIIS